MEMKYMSDDIKVQMLKTTGTLITTAFALVAGLAWNSAITKIINTFLQKSSAVTGLLIYAIVVTVIAVVITVFIGRALGKVGIEMDD
jgi:hypothetical protein